MPPILRLTTLSATLRPAVAWRLPPHPEVMVRGALGARLFDLRCQRDDRDCVPCVHRATCVIPTWWDPGRGMGRGVRPFVPIVPAGGGVQVGPAAPWVLRIVLLMAVPEPELILTLLEEVAFAGLGPDRVRHALERVEVHGESEVVVWEGQRTGAAWPATRPVETPPVDLQRLRSVRVRFATPWKPSPSRGRPSTGVPTPADLVRAAMNRVRPVQRAQGLSLRDHWWPEPADLSGHWEDHWVQRVQVRSGRQDQVLDLSGHRGTMVLGPEIAPWAGLLAAVSVIQIGRQTSYGLGRFDVEWVAR